jgi:hypothetical protein
MLYDICESRRRGLVLRPEEENFTRPYLRWGCEGWDERHQVLERHLFKVNGSGLGRGVGLVLMTAEVLNGFRGHASDTSGIRTFIIFTLALQKIRTTPNSICMSR